MVVAHPSPTSIRATEHPGMSAYSKIKHYLSACYGVFLVLALSGCYVPLQFDADVVINRTGHFEMAFDGVVTWAPLYDQIRRGQLTPSEERTKVGIIKTDLARDRAFSEIEYERRGKFKVSWHKAGDLLRSKMISFIRRNEKLLTLKYIKTTGEISLSGTSVSNKQAQRLADRGLNMAGTLRVRTDARVVRHNAHSVVEDGMRWYTYTWRLQSAYDPTPNLVIAVH